MQHQNVLHRGGLRAARKGRAVYRRVRRVPPRAAAENGTQAIAASEQFCQEITRRGARNFYWGFLALPRRQRVAIYALYSFSRQVDDAVDLHASSPSSLLLTEAARSDAASRAPLDVLAHPTSVTDVAGHRALTAQRRRIADCYSGNAADPVMRVLSSVVADYGIPRDELTALVRGVEMDLEKFRYETWSELEEYCRHVASAVGRMCVRIFGFSDPVALAHADDLGIALQITNILRDVREDAELGRTYLPRRELDRFGLLPIDFANSDPDPRWPELVAFQAARAQRYFESGLRVVEYIPRRAGVCVRTMAGMYTNILAQIEADPYLPLRRRARLRKRTKLKVMLGSWLRAV